MLYRLAPEGRRLLTQEFVTGAKKRHEPAEYEHFVETRDSGVSLDRFDREVADIIRATDPHDTAIDRLAAPRLHRALPLCRREAADPGIWRYLAVIRAPEFVRHRWEFYSWSTMRTRFWSIGTQHSSNTFYRLWWIAELTCDGNDYSLTERALATQPLATVVFSRRFSMYRPATEAFIDVMEDAGADELDRVAPRFNATLSTIVLEGQTADQLRALLRELRAG